MDYKDALELQILFTIAAQRAKEKNKIEVDYKLEESVLVEYLKKAYPRLDDTEEFVKLAQLVV